MRGGGIAVFLASGTIAHGLLGAGYAMAGIGGSVGVAVLDVVAGFSPAVLAWLLCRLFKVRCGDALRTQAD